MKKEKKFFNLINKDIPEKEWEGVYLIEKAKDMTNYLVSLFGIVVAIFLFLALLIVLTGTIQCSASFEFEGKGNIVLNEEELHPTFENFEFKEGKVKVAVTAPCSFLTQFGKYGGGN